MDDFVQRALAKWPDVPACYGWLALDARGRWRIGAERSVITSPAIAGFIDRNYGADDQGKWFFQNGPQRVYVRLDYTPYVWRLFPSVDQQLRLGAHTGQEASRVDAIWLDSEGRFLIEASIDRGSATIRSVGVLHDHDSASLAASFCDRDGSRLTEEEAETCVDAALASAKAGSSPDRNQTELWLEWVGNERGQQILPINAVAVDRVASHFGFDPDPLPIV